MVVELVLTYRFVLTAVLVASVAVAAAAAVVTVAVAVAVGLAAAAAAVAVAVVVVVVMAMVMVVVVVVVRPRKDVNCPHSTARRFSSCSRPRRRGMIAGSFLPASASLALPPSGSLVSHLGIQSSIAHLLAMGSYSRSGQVTAACMYGWMDGWMDG